MSRSSRAFQSWNSMRHRCLSPRNNFYKDYGGRGIEICERWAKFENFYADMGEAAPGFSIDRIDNNGPYSPENCRWATVAQQKRNTRRTKFLTFSGRTLCVTDWGLELGINKSTLISRLKYGWPIERALAEKVSKRQS